MAYFLLYLFNTMNQYTLTLLQLDLMRCWDIIALHVSYSLNSSRNISPGDKMFYSKSIMIILKKTFEFLMHLILLLLLQLIFRQNISNWSADMDAFAIHLIQTTIGSNEVAKQRNMHPDAVENGKNRNILSGWHQLVGKKRNNWKQL